MTTDYYGFGTEETATASGTALVDLEAQREDAVRVLPTLFFVTTACRLLANDVPAAARPLSARLIRHGWLSGLICLALPQGGWGGWVGVFSRFHQ